MLLEWAKKYCHTFESITQEHPLLHAQFHEEYCILFESIFSEFLINENITLQQFYSVISEQYTKQNSFAKMLTSAIEFESFIQMMVDVREGFIFIFIVENYYFYIIRLWSSFLSSSDKCL